MYILYVGFCLGPPKHINKKMGKNQEALSQNSNVSEANSETCWKLQTFSVQFGKNWSTSCGMTDWANTEPKFAFNFVFFFKCFWY